jgi:hypothetical protein
MSSTGFFNNFFGQVNKKKTSTVKTKLTKEKSKKTFEIPKGSVKYKKYYFVDIKKSKNLERKYDAIFIKESNGKEKIVSFGKKGKYDYLSTKDREQRDFYDFKHKGVSLSNLMSKESLEKYILWNKSSLEASIRDYKRRL